MKCTAAVALMVIWFASSAVADRQQAGIISVGTRLVREDRLDRKVSGWDEADTDDFRVRFEAGGYTITMKTDSSCTATNDQVPAVKGDLLWETDLAIDAPRKSLAWGPVWVDATAGLLSCFLVDGNGECRLRQRTGREWKDIGSPAPAHGLTTTPGASNRIAVAWLGDEVWFFVNGTLVMNRPKAPGHATEFGFLAGNRGVVSVKRTAWHHVSVTGTDLDPSDRGDPGKALRDVRFASLKVPAAIEGYFGYRSLFRAALDRSRTLAEGSAFREAVDVAMGPALRALQQVSPPDTGSFIELWDEVIVNSDKAEDFGRMIVAAENKLALAEKGGDAKSIRDAAIDCGRAHLFAKHWEKARGFLERVAAMAAGDSDPDAVRFASEVARTLSETCAHLHDYPAGAHWAEEAKRLAGKAGDKAATQEAEDWASSLQILLSLDIASEKARKTLETATAEEALRTYTGLISLEDRLAASIGDYRLADITDDYTYATQLLCARKKWAEAEALAARGIERGAELGISYQRTLWYLRGTALESQGKAAPAMASYERCVSEFTVDESTVNRKRLGFDAKGRLSHLGEAEEVSLYLLALWGVYERHGDKRTAGERLEQSTLLAGRLMGDAAGTVDRCFSTARVFFGYDDFDKAIEWFTRALEVEKKVSPRESANRATICSFLAEAYDAKGDWGSAISNYVDALKIRLAVLDPQHPDIALTYNNLGTVLYRAGRWKAAAEALEKVLALDLAAKGAQHADVIDLRISLSACYLADGDFQKSLARALEAQTAIESAGGKKHPLAWKCRNALGEAFSESGRYDEAMRSFSDAMTLAVAATGESSLEVARILNNIGLLHQQRGAPEKALPFFMKALAINGKVLGEQDPKVAAVCGNIATALRAEGDTGQARQYVEKELAICRKAFGENHPLTARAYDDLGVACSAAGDYDGALRNISRAVDIDRKILGEEHVSLAPLYGQLADISAYMGEYEAALASGMRSLGIIEKAYGAAHPNTADALDVLGGICTREGDAAAARAYHERALSINLKSFGDNSLSVAKTYMALGQAYLADGATEKALVNLRKALSIQVRVLGATHPGVAETYNAIAMAEEDAKDHAAALEDFGNALRIVKAGASGPNTAMALSNVAYVKAELGRYAEAIAALQSVLPVLEGTALREAYLLQLQTLALCMLYAGDAGQARTTLEKAIAVVEAQRGESGPGKTSFMTSYFGVYLCALSAVAALQDMDGVFTAVERMRARSFLDELSLQAAASAAGVDRQKGGRLLELSDSIERLARRRSDLLQKPSPTQDPEVVVIVTRELEKTEAEFRTLDQALLANPRYRALRTPRLATLKEAQELCGNDAAILEYVLWERNPKHRLAYDIERSYCLVITKSAARLVELDRDYGYGEAIERLRSATINGNAAEREKAANELYAHVIEPVEDSVRNVKKLVIVPDGSLPFLPFDALRKTADGPYLCERYEVTMSPSVSILAMVEGRRWQGSRGAFLGFGGALYEPGSKGESRGHRGGIAQKQVNGASRAYRATRGAADGLANYFGGLGIAWANLPGTRVEVESIIKDVYHGAGVRVLVGDTVKEAEAKRLSREGELARWRLLHFACHGYWDQQFPSLSAIVMGDVAEKGGPEDGYLTVEEVCGLKLEADLVNLSACETGLGRVVKGDGVLGLTRAFNIAGANRVGVTLWQVDDAATKDFMVGVYGKQMAKGMEWGEAWTAVKREFIHSQDFSDPYYWSPFVLYGR
jgi:CHAT domain-containing protein/Tfp pilus assembly protein PilF